MQIQSSTHFFCIVLFVSITLTIALPPKIDLGLIIDTSTDMTKRDFNKSKQLITKLLDNFSISPGTTRVGFYTIGDRMEEIFHFKEHVNRECLLKSIKRFEYVPKDKSYNFQNQISDAIHQMQSNSRKIIDQRKIYFLFTNSLDDITTFYNDVNVKLTLDDMIGLILVANNNKENIVNVDVFSGDEASTFEDNEVKSPEKILVKQNLQPKDCKTNATCHDLKTLEEKSEYDEANSYNNILTPATNYKKKIINDTSFFQEEYKDKRQNKNLNQNVKLYNSKYSKLIEQILKDLQITPHSYSTCQLNDGQTTVYDECNRQCTCRNGTFTYCYRVRQELTAMSITERSRYLHAYKTLTSVSPYKEIYERFVFMHYKYFCWGIHNREYFLPWHRWFISEMENLLKQIDCRVTLAYWDWSYVSHDPWNREKLWRPTDDGLGGNGNMYKGYCVEKGIFRESEWESPYWEDPMDIILSTTDQLSGNISEQRGHLAFCLRRAFKGHTPSLKSVERTLALPAKRFKDFDIQIRHNYHDRIHNIIGGTMCTHYAGNTPEFWLHHGMLDKIWFLWQQKSKQHLYVHFLQMNTTKMMGTKYTQKQLINCKHLPRCIKIKYTQFPIKERTKRAYDDIDDMARTSHKYWDKYLNESWYGHFPDCSRTKKDKKRAKYLHKILDGP